MGQVNGYVKVRILDGMTDVSVTILNLRWCIYLFSLLRSRKGQRAPVFFGIRKYYEQKPLLLFTPEIFPLRSLCFATGSCEKGYSCEENWAVGGRGSTVEMNRVVMGKMSIPTCLL